MRRDTIKPLMCLAALGVCFAIALWRAPQVFMGRFWAEEGVYYALFPTIGTIKALLFTGPGYPVFLTNASVLLSEAFPVAFAPLVTTVIGFCAHLVLVALILFWHERLGLSLPIASSIAILTIILPHAAEVSANSTNLQWIASAISAVILLDAKNNTKRLSCCILFIAGLAGAAPILLIPAFVAKYAIDRSRSSLAEFASLSAASLIVTAFTFGTTQLAQRSYPVYPELYLSVVSAQTAMTVFLGFDVSVAVSNWYRAAPESPYALVVKLTSIVPIVAIFCVGASFQYTRRATILMAVGYWTSALIGIFGALGPYNLVVPIGRYFFAPNVMLLLLLGHLGTRFAPLVTIPALAALIILHSLPSAVSAIFFEGPSWRSQIPQDGIHEATSVKIWPPGWIITLLPR